MKPTREEVLRLMRQASGGILTQVAEDPRCGYEIKVEELQTFAELLHARASNECGRTEFETYANNMGTHDFERPQDGGDGYSNPYTQGRWIYWVASRDALGMQPPNNQNNADHVAVISAKPDSVHLAVPVETATDTRVLADTNKRVVSRMQDSDYQTMMALIGMPNSKSLLLALKQVANWTEQAVRAESGISSQDRRPDKKDVDQEGK